MNKKTRSSVQSRSQKLFRFFILMLKLWISHEESYFVLLIMKLNDNGERASPYRIQLIIWSQLGSLPYKLIRQNENTITTADSKTFGWRSAAGNVWSAEQQAPIGQAKVWKAHFKEPVKNKNLVGAVSNWTNLVYCLRLFFLRNGIRQIRNTEADSLVTVSRKLMAFWTLLQGMSHNGHNGIP